MTLKGQISLCLAAFFLALAGQIFLSFYQSGTVLRELDDQMGNFNAISRFQNGVERSLSAMEDYRWEYGDAKALTEELHSAFSVTNAWLWRIEGDLGTVSEEQYLLYNAVSTTYDSYTALVDQLEEAVAAGQDAKAAQLYYNKNRTLRRLSAPVHPAAAEHGHHRRSGDLHHRVGPQRPGEMGADRRGGALPCAGLRHGLLGADAADPGAADDRRLPGGHPGRVRLARPACAPSAGNGPADRSLQPHEAFDGRAGDHPAGEKRDGAGAPPPENGSSGITEPDGAQPFAAAAQPDRPPFPFQHPERHFTDRRTGKKPTARRPSSRLCRTCCATA